MILQQVNLYQPVDDVRREAFSALMMLIFIAFTIVLMSGFYGFLFWEKETLDAEMTALKNQYQQNLSAVEKLEVLANNLADTSKEKAKLSTLKSSLENKKLALSELSSMIKGNSKGMSNYFSALARKNIEQVWFSELNVSDGGQQLLLKGKTQHASYLPQFMALLREEPVFAGINFKLFNARVNDKDGLVDFNLQTDLESSPAKLSERQ